MGWTGSSSRGSESLRMLETRRLRLLAATLSGVAGFVDAVGWLTSGGLFVSFMSGNTTKLGIGIAGQLDNAVLAVGLLSCFVAGVVLGSLAGRAAPGRQQAVVMWLVTAMMTAAAGLQQLGLLQPAVLVLAATMGALNTVFAENGEVKFGLTYMTGALVRVGKRLAGAIRGGDPWGWVSSFSLFMGMLTGAVLGALCHALTGAQALWGAVAALGMLALVAGRLGRPDG